MMPENFADRLMLSMERKRSQICAGLDPKLDAMPPHLLKKYRRQPAAGCGCGRHEVAACFEEFCTQIIDAVAGHVVAVKLQSACFEQYGPPGIKAFKHACDFAAARDLLVIADVKRGDIGISAAAYSAAYLGRPPGLNGPVKPFNIDAVTVNPLFGTDGVEPFLEDCREFGKGIFLLVKTSNPSSAELQDLKLKQGEAFHEHVARLAAGWGRDLVGACGYSSVGAVAGATHPQTLANLRKLLPGAVLLVPGVGAQGAGVKEAAVAFDKNGLGAIISSSRSIIYAGNGLGYADMAAEAARCLKAELWDASH